MNVISDTSGECWEDILHLGTTSPENGPFVVSLLLCRLQQVGIVSQPGRAERNFVRGSVTNRGINK
jgi:hypothetical protein